MNQSIAIDFTRIGLICDFLAFFLAAPEILGEERIRKIQNTLRRSLVFFSFALFIFSIINTFGLLVFWIIIPVSNTVTAAIALSPMLLNSPVAPTEFIKVYLILGVGGAFLSWIPLKVMNVVENLGSNARFRRQLLNLGVLLFIFGAAAQLIGTF